MKSARSSLHSSSRKRSTVGYAPRYAVIEEQQGFRVEGRDRCPVFVRLAPSQTFLVVSTSPDAGPWDEYAPRVYRCGLYGYRRLLALIAERTMQSWQRPAHPPSHWSGVHSWALSRTRQALHHRGVYAQWQRLLTLVPQPQQQVTRAVFAATFDSTRSGCETWPEIYEHPYLLEDVLRYRAAACALHYAAGLATIVGCVSSMQRALALPTFCPGPQSERFEAFSARDEDPLGSDDLLNLDGRRALELLSREERSEVIAFLTEDWKALYSGCGKAGKSLRRTLMNLPGGVSGRLLCELPKLEGLLNRPVTDRVVLTTLLLWAHHVTRRVSLPVAPEVWEGHLYLKAQREEILTALHLLSAYRQRVLPPEPALTPWRRSLALLVDYLDDYCHACRQQGLPAHRGTIVGLTEKALRWHREVQERQEYLYQGLLDGTALSALPPVPLPDHGAITFLGTAKAILNEGSLMHHCIASYAAEAVRGNCYLFHVDYQNTQASVQVDPAGRVLQSYGPCNSWNAAAEYGRRILSQWGATFPHRGGADEETEPALPDDAYLPF